MKSRLYYLLWLFAIAPLAFISCDDDNEIEEATLEVSMDPVNFAKAGGEQTVTITTNMGGNFTLGIHLVDFNAKRKPA